MDLKSFAAALVLGLGGCAGLAPEESVALLEQPPERAYRELGRIDAQGRIAGPRETAYDELRSRAAALGADAVIKLDEERRYRAPPDPSLEGRTALGDPYPDLVESLRPGFFGYEGSGLRTVGGYYWVVSGVAIAYE